VVLLFGDCEGGGDDVYVGVFGWLYVFVELEEGFGCGV